MATSIVQFRIEDDLKAQATEIFDKLGLDLSTALRIFLKRSVAVKGIPFSMTLDNDVPFSEANDNDVAMLSEKLMAVNDEVYKELAK